MARHSDDRAPLAQAFVWSSRVMTIALEMVVPGAIGYWIDTKLGTFVLFLVLGVIVGMTTGLIHLVRLVSLPDREDSADDFSSNERDN